MTDTFGWYLFLADASLDHMWNYEPMYGSRVVPVLAAIGRNLAILRTLDGLEDGARRLVRAERRQPNGGRTDRPVYHVFCTPDPGVADNAAARSRFWSLFEREFEMAGQPYAGVEHRKDDRVHEHRVYEITKPSGAVVNLSWDHARRKKCARIVEFEHDMEAVPPKHARTIANRRRRDGRNDIAN